MLKDRHHILRASVLEQPRPRSRFETFSLETRDELFVAEFVGSAVGCYVMLVFVRAGHIHIPWIPFIPKRRNGVHAPVNENSEFRVLVPLRHFIAVERLPLRPKRTGVVSLIDLLQNGVPRGVKLGARSLPYLVNLGWIRGGRGSRKVLRQRGRTVHNQQPQTQQG